MKYTLSLHAEEEIARRKIDTAHLLDVLTRPQQIVDTYAGRRVYQSKVSIDGRVYLLRAIVDGNVDPSLVLTVYRTSKVEKYWSKS